MLSLAAVFGQQLIELTPEQRKTLIDQHYAKAFEFYAAKDFGRAIGHWQQVLRLDPDQQTAKKLVAEARDKLSEKNQDKEKKLEALIAEGSYGSAFELLQVLLDSDPTNERYLETEARMGKIVSILPEAERKGKAWAVLRKGLAAYLGAKGTQDLGLAFNALRYSRELIPGNKPVEKLLAMFESSHPDVAGSDRVPQGMGFLEYKELAALNFIYDGKYPEAIKVCEEILALEPEDVRALKRYGSAYYAMGKKESARAVWQKALRLSPDDAQLKKYLEK